MTIHGREVFGGAALTVETSERVIGAATARASEAGAGPDLPWIAPGLFDAQVNGYRGSDYSGDDFDAAAARRIADALAAAGTTQHLATIITSPPRRIVRNIEVLAAAVRADEDLAAAIPGIHIEGPFIASEDGPRGAHAAEYVRDPDPGELREWHAAARGLLRLVTIAPERQGAIAFIEQACALGVTIAIGHTAADAAAIRRAIDAGATVSTHLGNGSHPTLPRLRNYLWEQLASDDLTAGVIPDGFHVPDAPMRVFARAKGLDRLFLVSDAGTCAGLPPGRYRWDRIEVDVHPDGHLSLAGTPLLAAAGHLLDWGIAHFARATGLPLSAVVRLATAAPARVFGLADPKDAVVAGRPADLVVFRWDPRGERLRIERTVRGGRTIYGA
jgi:N-acetylglucosamine-6-phosphate deacetylase